VEREIKGSGQLLFIFLEKPLYEVCLDFVDSIYPIELEVKDTTDTDISASYLDLHLEIDSEGR
jgi:hypothetical protein